MRILLIALIVCHNYGADLCSSSNFPIAFGGTDNPTIVTCIAGLNSSMNPLVVAGSTYSSSFSTLGVPFPYAIFVDPTTGEVGFYHEYLTTTATKFQDCAGCEHGTCEGAALATNDPFTLYFIDSTNDYFSIAFRDSLSVDVDSPQVMDMYYKDYSLAVFLEHDSGHVLLLL